MNRVKSWQSVRPEPAGGAGPGTRGAACALQPGAPPGPLGASGSGRALCPFKEAGRTTRTFLTGGYRANLGQVGESLEAISWFSSRLPESSRRSTGAECPPPPGVGSSADPSGKSSPHLPGAPAVPHSGPRVPRACLEWSSPAEAPVPGCPSGLARANTVSARGRLSRTPRARGAGSPATSGRRAGGPGPARPMVSAALAARPAG